MTYLLNEYLSGALISQVPFGINFRGSSEGFTNEQGAHILWQFADNSPETWWMAVLQEGEWVTFDVDLGNENHREAFFRGDVPAGITPDKQT